MYPKTSATVSRAKTDTSLRTSNDTKTNDQMINNMMSAVEWPTPAQTPRTTLLTSRTTQDHDVTSKSETIYRKSERMLFYRRSERAAVLLRDNMPNTCIAMNLAARFSALYTDEYADAFEELVKSRYYESAAIFHLLRVVRSAFNHFQKWNLKIEHQLQMEQEEISKLEDEHILGRERSEKKKKIVIKEKDMVVQDFMETMISTIFPQQIALKGALQYKRYAEHCVEIVWWMCVQNPPMHLEWLQDRSKSQPPQHKFDSDLYRSYTKSGEYVDYCVWPLVRLHKDGPIISRGIAQGMH